MKCELSVKCRCEPCGGWHSQTGRATHCTSRCLWAFGLFVSFALSSPFPFLSFPFSHAQRQNPTRLTRPSCSFPTTAARRAYLSLLRAHGRACSSSISSGRRHSFTGRLRILDYRSRCFDTFTTVVLNHARSPLCMRY